MARIRFAAIGAAVLLMAGTASAQQGHDKRAQRDAEQRGMGQVRGRDGAAMRLFRGIDLTEAQRTQIRDIRQKYRAQLKAQHAAIREARRADTTSRGRPQLTDAQLTQLRQLREQELAEVRSVLTVEQRTQFDRNVAELRDRRADRAAKGERGGKGKGNGRNPGRGR